MSEAELTLGVNGMACEGCAKSVARAINQIDPAARVSVDLAGKRVRIEAAQHDKASYEAAVSRAGYEILPEPRA